MCLCDGGGGLVAKSCQTLATLWTVVHQPPLSMGFPRHEYWSGSFSRGSSQPEIIYSFRYTPK